MKLIQNRQIIIDCTDWFEVYLTTYMKKIMSVNIYNKDYEKIYNGVWESI